MTTCINLIDESWSSRQHWIDGGLAAFRIALHVRSSLRIPAEIAVGFSLISGDGRTGVDFTTQEGLAERLNWMPPSLCLFAAGWDPARENDKAKAEGLICSDAIAEVLQPSVFGASEPGQIGHYIEFTRPGNPEYYRTVFLLG